MVELGGHIRPSFTEIFDRNTVGYYSRTISCSIMKFGVNISCPLADILEGHINVYHPCLMLCCMVESGGRIWPSSTGIIDTTLVTSIHIPDRLAR